MPVQIGGPIGPFLDNVQQRQVPVVVVATCDYTGPSGPQVDEQVRTEMLRAIRDVIAPKMASGQLSFRHLGTGDTAAIIPEIIAMSGLEQRGFRIGNLAMSFGIDGRAAPPPTAPKKQAGGTIASAPGPGLGIQVTDRAKSQLTYWAIRLVLGLVVAIILAIVGWKGTSGRAKPGQRRHGQIEQHDGRLALGVGFTVGRGFPNGNGSFGTDSLRFRAVSSSAARHFTS